MSWLAAIALGVITGFLVNRTINPYYSVRFKLKSQAKEIASIGVDSLALIWILSLGYLPSYILHFAFEKEDLYERIIALLIFGAFLISDMRAFKKENPDAYRTLFRSSPDKEK